MKVSRQKPSDTTELNQSNWLITTIYRKPKPRKNARCPASGRRTKSPYHP
jgi:hypothetical protein